ncbi:hypothetical protein H6P81_013649 [Aristolochia fimbriata]|uniref:Elongator complex protein 4 n=1 Tax=Aristolochia fimbriata TaxID=158543 RepID=A0AAV7EI54_ARIFI|nr:hypothetical protein H6P81_013649 [Aristolochia fimbriata]
MSFSRTKTSSFSRTVSSEGSARIPGVKHVANGVNLVSSGIADLDKILGGGLSLGTVVMIMEDPEAPHHLLLLRNFMSQGIVHNQPLLFASPVKDPRAFLGTLPSPVSPKDHKRESIPNRDPDQENGLRIAWQYKKYFGEQQIVEHQRDGSAEYCNDFDLRKPFGRQIVAMQTIDCISIQDSSSLALLQDRCSRFLAQYSRNDSGGIGSPARIAIQSLCAPQCGFASRDWDILSFIRSLRSMIRSSNAVAVISFPPSVLLPCMSKRLQHLSDTLLSVKAIPDEDKDLAELLTDYQDMVGLLRVHKVGRINTQVPFVLDTTTFSIKLQKRRSLVLERLNQAPVDGSSGSSYASSGSCSVSKTSSLDF